MLEGHPEAGRKVKVCCFCERWESGGIESFLFNVLTTIDLKELQVDLVAASLGESIFTEPLQKLGIRFFELSGSQKKVLKNCRRFSSLLKERCWDVIHLNAFFGLSLSYLYLAKQGGCPIRIAHSHNTALRESLIRPIKLTIHAWAKSRFTRYATDLWACSKSAAEFLFSEKIMEEKGFQFVPNGIDICRFRFDPAVRKSVRMNLGLNDKFVVGNVGRLCYQKNQVFLLDVFVEVLKRNPNSRLLLVGEGEDLLALQENAEHLGIREKIVFHGLSDHIERLLDAMDVFAFPSKFEGFGIAAIEAQAAGLPVVASEFVPEEVQVAGQFWTVPLGRGAQEWARVLLARQYSCIERTGGAAAVRDAGFDAAEMSRQIEETYFRLRCNG